LGKEWHEEALEILRDELKNSDLDKDQMQI
jgi:hypothetical protein